MERQELAFLSLKGVSVGDAFGESFFLVSILGIVAISSSSPVPKDWLNRVEQVENSVFRNKKS